ncbi:MAG: hypothetical protein COB49_00785 [Alphaproteobacteria bacterium]|nr:MAG: hypothetical protein COB49_00785 [Alphaproteobacteria bacterium]
MSRKNKNNNASTHKTIRRWHRWVGYTSLFFVLILSITGLILNRAEKFSLNQIMIQNDLISSLYSQPPSAPPVHFKAGDDWISWLEGRIYLSGNLIGQNSSPLVGAALLNDLIIAPTKDSLSLYLTDGSLVEIMDSSSLPGEITAIGHPTTDSILIETSNGIYKADAAFISWQKMSDTVALSPVLALQPPDQISEKIMQDFRGQGVTLSRLVLDLHSGHIMGSFGPYIMDLAALSLIFLGVTGLMQRKRSDKDRRKKK